MIRMQEIERQVSCPYCKTPTRITRCELIDKRGYCASCDARFDLVQELFLADAPYRATSMVASSLPALAPTGKMAIARDDDDHEVITVSSARQFPYRESVFGAAWFTMLALVCAHAGTGFDATLIVIALFQATVVAMTARGVLRAVRGRDRLTFGQAALRLEQRGALWTRTSCVPYEDIVAVRVEPQPPSAFTRNLSPESLHHRVLLERAGADPLCVADSFGHYFDSAAWLAAQIDRAARSARRPQQP